MTVFAFTGSFCTVGRALSVLPEFTKTDEVLPVVSESVRSTDTRFGKADGIVAEIERLCGRPVIKDIASAEPIGPIYRSDFMVICPCTGNTLAKLAHGITDSTVTMAAKSHLRNGRPLLVCLASNDAMSANFENVGRLMARKNVFFSPLVQDDPENKPTSLVFAPGLVIKAADAAREGRQIRPLFI